MSQSLLRWKALWNPDMYHGWGRENRYFEGWYIKIVDNTEGVALAFIPGISMAKDGTKHAFIQVLDGKQCTVAYHRFDAFEFKPSDTSFFLQIADNQFSTHKIKLNLPNIVGELTFENPVPWDKMYGAPGIMGWFSFMPFMECYHGIVSLDHHISGALTINDKENDFTNGRGYIEKDWGISFPRAWIWLQTNHFFEKNADFTDITEGVSISQNLNSTQTSLLKQPISLIASVAHIPFLGTYFIGYIVGFLYKGKLHRFATYTGAKMKANIDGNDICLYFKNSIYELHITATKAGTGSLISPIQGEMTGKVNESLQANIHIKFFEHGKLIFEGVGRNAGLEAAGEVDVLLTDKWRR